MGGPYGGNAPTTTTSYNDVANNFMSRLPSFLNTLSSGQQGADIAAARSAQQTTPMYNQLALGQLQQFGVPMAQVGNQINQASQLGGAATQQQILGQYAPQLASTYRQSDMIANPEYYKTLGTAAQGAQNLINSINLNGLSGSERSEVERSLGQSQTATGNLGLDNATNAVQNAMTFGSALQQKRDALGQALQTATGLMGASKNGFNPLQAMGNSGNNNLGTSQFQGVTPGGNQAWGFGSGMLGGLTGLANTQMGTQWESNKANSFAGVLGSQTSAIGNVCCFIFLEALNGNLPPHVRFCRDYFYEQEPRMAAGYRRMAKWLVPLMGRFRLVKHIVNAVMVRPIVRYGYFLLAEYPMSKAVYSRKDEMITSFWFKVWKHI